MLHNIFSESSISNVIMTSITTMQNYGNKQALKAKKLHLKGYMINLTLVISSYSIY